MDYTTEQIAEIFNVTRPTVTAWAKEFSDYLGALTNPGKGAHRKFSADDLSVVALIAEMKAINMNNESIHASLRAGERKEVDQNKVMAIITTGSSAGARMLEQMQSQQGRIRELELELARREGQQSGQVDLLKQQLSDAQETIIELRVQVAMLKSSQDSKA